MSTKKKTPAPVPAPQQPLSLEDRAKNLHTKIAECEDGSAPLYLELGGVLEGIKEEQQCNWTELLEYATVDLDLARSRVTRALRIHKFYKDHPEKLNGLSVYEALQHEPKDKPKPQPVGSPLTQREAQAARRFEQAVGGQDRAVEVLTRIVINHEEPVKGTGKGGKRPKLTPVVKLFGTKLRDTVRKDVPGYIARWAEPVLKADEDYVRRTDEAIADATTEEKKAHLLDVLNGLKQERNRKFDRAGDAVSRSQIDKFDHDKVAFVVDVQRMVNEALGVPPAAEQPAVEQPAAVSVPSAN